MSTQEIIVTLAGLGMIVWVNYYFFFAGRSVVTLSEAKGSRGGSAGKPSNNDK